MWSETNEKDVKETLLLKKFDKEREKLKYFFKIPPLSESIILK